MSIKFTDQEGREFEFRGEYKTVHVGDYFLPSNSLGNISSAVQRDANADIVRAIVHPIPVYHDFGGIRFKETGEVIVAQPGEWFILNHLPAMCTIETSRPYTIIIPDSIISTFNGPTH